MSKAAETLPALQLSFIVFPIYSQYFLQQYNDNDNSLSCYIHVFTCVKKKRNDKITRSPISDAAMSLANKSADGIAVPEKRTCSWAWWHTPVILATREAEAGGQA